MIDDPSIPTLSHSLVGREDEMTRLRQRLQGQGNAALTALNGLPGVGKTTLLIALAQDPALRAHFTGGILWAGLGPMPNLQNHLSRWGALLGLSQAEMSTFKDSVDWAVALRRAISDRPMLLVIDDAWTLADALALLVGGRNCAHLVSTRFPAIAAEVAADGAATIEELSIDEGMALLRQLAPEVVERDMQRAGELVIAVGGLPLALNLIGNYLRSSTDQVATALQRLTDAGERLNLSEPRGSIGLHPSLTDETPVSLRTVIAVTHEQLPQELRLALHALAVFPPRPNGFSEDAALFVAACQVEILDQLTDAGLLEITRADRYSLHQTIADYARFYLSDATVHQRFIIYMTTVVKRHQKNYELLEIESANILAALDAAIELDRHAEQICMICAFAPFLLARSLYNIAERHLQHASTITLEQNNQHTLARVLLYLGDMAWKRRQSEQAEKYLCEGLGHARTLLDNELVCEFLAKLGTIRWKSGNYLEAETFLREGLSLARQTGNVENASEILSILGSVAMRQGHYAQAEVFLREGLSLARQTGARERMCPILINLGLLAAEQNKPGEAESSYKESLALARDLGHSEWISVSLNNLGDVVSEGGDYAQAEVYFQEGLQLARSIDQLEGVSFLLMNLGAVACKQGKYEAAECALQESLVLAQQIGIPLGLSHTLNEYGNLHLARKQPEQAEVMFQKMLETAPEGSQDLVALAQYGLARALALQGKRDEAIQLGTISVQMLEAIGLRNPREVRAWLTALESLQPLHNG